MMLWANRLRAKLLLRWLGFEVTARLQGEIAGDAESDPA